MWRTGEASDGASEYASGSSSAGGRGTDSGTEAEDERTGAAVRRGAPRDVVGGRELGDAPSDGLLGDDKVGAAGLAGLQLLDEESRQLNLAGDDPDGTLDAACSDPRAERSATGAFTGVLRNRRKMQAATFPIIERTLLEPATCGQLSGCVAKPRCAAHGGAQCQQWRIRGPVLGWSDDAVRLTTNIIVRATPSMPAAEVYVRALPHLVPSVYARSTTAYNSVRFVGCKRHESTALSGSGSMRCSFRGLAADAELTDKDVKEVVKRASSSLVAAKGKLQRGYVSLVERGNARGDAVLKSAVRALLRKRSIRAAADYRDKGAALMRGRTAGLTGILGAGSIGRVRRHLELHPSSGPGARATRLRVSWGLSQMRLLPSRKQLQKIRRESIDAPGNVAHYLLTTAAQGGVLRWDYVVGSGSAGVRRYHTACGMERRLRSHTNKYWDQRRSTRDDEDVSENEDDGVYFDNTNAELNGCYAPEEKDPVAIEQLIASSQSFLENDDGSGEILVLGVGFDVTAALQQTLAKEAVPGLTADQVQNFPRAALTFAADGGELRRRSVTAYTLSVSTPCLLKERTDLIPILYVFMGEKRVSRAVTKWVRDQLAAVYESTLQVPVICVLPSDGDAVHPEGLLTEAGGVGHGCGSRTAPLLWHPVLHVCGTFQLPLWVAGIADMRTHVAGGVMVAQWLRYDANLCVHVLTSFAFGVTICCVV